MQSKLGRVHVITGPGKGKTSAAFGMAMRASGHGLRVHIIQFMKTGETTGEALAAKKLDGVRVEQFGTGEFIDVREGPSEADRKAAAEALARARSVLTGGECDVLILDEVNFAASAGLITASEVLELLKESMWGVEIVLTGVNAPSEFVEYADYVSVVECKKHPYAKGLSARRGIEW